MPDSRYAFMPPRNAALRWLSSPGPDVSPQVAAVLLGELFASPGAVMVAMTAALLLSIAAFCDQGGAVFAGLVAAFLAIIPTWRIVVWRIVKDAAGGAPRPTDIYFLVALSWCGLLGALAFFIMRTGSHSLQLLAASLVMGMGGPICARNYAAPRFAIALLCLSHLAFAAGAAFSGQRLLIILAMQAPLFIYGSMSVLTRFNGMALAALRAEEESFQVARHDCLTGLLNRFGLLEMLERQYARPPYRFILFYLDLDGFKPINDVFGHHAGDRMLGAVAARLKAAIRPNDIASRLGGDEFVIVAPDMSAEEGAAYAERVIAAIATNPYEIEGVGHLRIGISIGFACAPDDGALGDDLHRKADAALYEAKGAGRGVQRRFGETARSSPQAPAEQRASRLADGEERGHKAVAVSRWT